jgi:6-phosphogluconolactonase
MNLAALLAAANVALLVQGTQKAAMLSGEARASRTATPLPIDHLFQHRTRPLRMYWSP